MDNHKLRMLHSSGDCLHQTPPVLFEALARVWKFDLDLAATAENCLVTDAESAYYLGPDHPDPELQDALKVPWHTMGKVGFLNPTYSLSQYKVGLDAGIDRADLQFLLIENWAAKAFHESLKGFTTIGVFPYAAQTEWFREHVMGHGLKEAKANKTLPQVGWKGHAALDYWRIPHRVSFLTAQGETSNNANVNSCIVIWGPNPGWIGPWVPSGRFWSYR